MLKGLSEEKDWENRLNHMAENGIAVPPNRRTWYVCPLSGCFYHSSKTSKSYDNSLI